MHIIEHLEIADLARFSATSSFNRELVIVQLEEAGVWVDAYGKAFHKKQSYPGSAYLAFVRKAMTRVLRSSCDQVQIVKSPLSSAKEKEGIDELRGMFLARDNAQPWKLRYLVATFASGRATTYDLQALYVRSKMEGGEHRNTQMVVTTTNGVEIVQSIKQNWDKQQRCEHLKCVHSNKLLRLKFPTRADDNENVFALWEDVDADVGELEAEVAEVRSIDGETSSAASSSPSASPRASRGEENDFVFVEKDISMGIGNESPAPFMPHRMPLRSSAKKLQLSVTAVWDRSERRRGQSQTK